jgi:hypothetical protein
MSDQPAEAPATDADAADQPDPQPKPTETVEFWKQKAREQEKRAKENADAAKRLAEIEDANKSETQRAAERVASLEQEVAAARREALRFKVASKFGIGDEDADLFLTGSDEDTLTKQAERLAARSEQQKPHGLFVPREGATSTTVDGDERRQVTRQLFARG